MTKPVTFNSARIPGVASTTAEPKNGFHESRQLPSRPARTISEKDFRKMFGILATSVSHEIGGGINFLCCLNQDDKKINETLFRLYIRITLLGRAAAEHLSTCDDPLNIHQYFTKQEQMELGLAINKDRLFVSNIETVKTIVNEDILLFRSSILELVSVSEKLDLTGYGSRAVDKFRIHKNRLPEYAGMLCDLLEQLMHGNELFEHNKKFEKEARKVIGFVTKNSSTIVEAQEGIGDRRIAFHPVFIALIIENIYSNASRAMEGAHDPQMFLRVFEKSGNAAFEFRDNGCGMNKETMDKLNAGERVTTKSEDGEHGLGFGYSRELARKMGGNLYIQESTIGKGTTVTLELPLANPELQPLVESLSSNDSKTRACAIVQIRHLKEDISPALGALLIAVNDPDRGVRHYATASIGRLAMEQNPEAIGMLGSLLMHESEVVKGHSEMYLANVFEAGVDIAPAQTYINAWIDRICVSHGGTVSSYGGISLLNSLARSGNKNALEALETIALENPDESVKMEAKKVLEKIMDS